MSFIQERGKWGEEEATRYLKEKGYRILKRNQRTPYGEIDIIADKEKTLIIIEVKARSSDKFGNPEEAVTRKKQDRIRQSCLWWIQQNKYSYNEIRFDVIGILRKGDNWEIKHWISGFE